MSANTPSSFEIGLLEQSEPSGPERQPCRSVSGDRGRKNARFAISPPTTPAMRSPPTQMIYSTAGAARAGKTIPACAGIREKSLPTDAAGFIVSGDQLPLWLKR